MRTAAGALIAVALTHMFSGCSPAQPTPPAAPASPLVGHWRSASFEGEDIPPGIREVEFVFHEDGTFKAVATGLADGKPATQVREGTYSVTGNAVAVEVPNQPTAPATPYYFEGAELILEDPGIDSRVRFRRVTD